MSVALPRSGERGNGTTSLSAEWQANAVAERGAFGRGMRWALGIEGVVALGIYALWHLWMLVR